MNDLPIGLVVEGRSDYDVIPHFLNELGIRVGRPAVFYGQGEKGSIDALVGRIAPHVAALVVRKEFKRVIAVVDLESRDRCPGEFATDIYRGLLKQLSTRIGYNGKPGISVVCADRCLENWILADPDGIARHKFIVNNPSGRIRNNADGCDAIRVLDWAYGPSRKYNKARDALPLALKVRIARPDVQGRSRSLRKLIKEASLA